MTILRKTQERDCLDEFNCVAALYQTLAESRSSLKLTLGRVHVMPSVCGLDSASEKAKIKLTAHRAEAQELPGDFLCDVEIKTKRLLPKVFYDMFIRLGVAGTLDVLPEHIKLSLGKTWKYWGLTEEGAYHTLYAKNKLVRIMKGKINGDGFPEAGTDTETTGPA